MVPKLPLPQLTPALRSRRPRHPRLSSTTSTPSRQIASALSTPSWSVHSLRRGPEPAATNLESISPDTLRSLLGLSSLPAAKSDREASTMIATVQSQLRFVRAVQSVDTTGVRPLDSIRDETEDAISESTVTLADMKPTLDKEVPVGHHRRPTRVKDVASSKEEDWDPLAMAPKKEGKYFVVDASNKKEGSS
ncbi:hypothetical protein L249_2399 [Ophiocordyceps polyrhachis-furcata BCC 54312]|uniref:Glutamyl-tRNA amidotransferase complex subunit Gta3 domain-containing protein n=1 Tax=Ophiocordyceps polyrhachis-furcata BCC 54312 TaxID=1330021 RepID=A0A367LPI1_9HYPO|nr:hypothetical protein L249_2399 [Ophiocordyceps polyrhachis-furcata BCC 54312]